MPLRSRGLCISLTVLVTVLSFASGCSSKPKTTAEGKPVSGTDEQIFLGDTIEKNYDPNVIMKRGEAFFDKEEYAEAIVEYQHFLELHRAHQLAVYAQFRMAESHLRMAKSIDRDPEPIQKAITDFEKLRKEFPGSKYEGQALQRIEDCHDWLAKTHLFVGQFYYRRASYLAAAHRFDQIMKDYPDKQVAPEALYYLALTYQELGANDWATEKLELLAAKYPNSEFAGDGRRLLAKLEKKPSSSPPAVVAKADAPTSETQPATQLLAATAPSSSFSSISASTDQRGPSAASLSLRQPFVSCRLGAWC
ncbi:MAG: outer membrane protein assembly factor BamD [Nitrospira defluvii]|nr:outer membrane protein assembly factor BamD [Nitrospira defluvii]